MVTIQIVVKSQIYNPPQLSSVPYPTSSIPFITCFLLTPSSYHHTVAICFFLLSTSQHFTPSSSPLAYVGAESNSVHALNFALIPFGVSHLSHLHLCKVLNLFFSQILQLGKWFKKWRSNISLWMALQKERMIEIEACSIPFS